MRNLYLKILVITSLLIGGPVLFAQFIFDKNPINSNRSSTDCSAEIPSGGFTDGIVCNKANGEIAANDIMVPVGSNLTLNSVMANMILEEGVTITSATIWIFYDEYGYPDRYPGFEHSSQSVIPTSHTLINSDAGMDYYEVLWDLSPIFLEGYEAYFKRYWVGISATTSNGSTPLWEVTGDNAIGQAAAFSTGSWFDLLSSGKDGSYIFSADCEPMSDGGGATDCSAEIPSGGFTDGIVCNEANGEIAANDIMVPVGSNLTLNSVMANMILEEGVTISSATIWIFYDEYGYPDRYPGYEFTSQSLPPTSQTLINNDAGMDYYEVLWDLSPIVLEGYEAYYKRYWVGISATTSDGSTPLWEVTGDNAIGQAAAFSTGSWFDLLSSGKDGVYIFSADCAPMSEEGEGETNCDASIPTAGFEDSFPCNAMYNYSVANDIVVPMGYDMTLNAIMANISISELGDSITSATIRIYADAGGAPDASIEGEITSQILAPTSHTLLNTNEYGMAFYEVLWDLTPVALDGKLNADMRYWIGLSVETSGQYVDAHWEVTNETMIGLPVFNSYGSGFQMSSGKDGVYTFFAECEPTSDDGSVETVDCGAAIPSDVDADGEGQNCTRPSRAVANDIIVPANSDMVLTAVMPSLVLLSGQTVDYASVYVYLDDNGMPGEKISDELVLATSQTLTATYDGKDVYDVLFEIDPVFMAGQADVETTYWIGVSVAAVNGSKVHMEVAYDTSIGHPMAVKSGTNYTIPNPNQDGVYTFYADCHTIDGLTGPEDGFCGNSVLEVNQDSDQDCFGYLNTGGMFQSFTAQEVESSGAGVKFTDQSRGLEVTLSLWDGLSTGGGNMLATRTTETYGGQWVDVFWESEVELTIGEQYFIRIEGDNGLSCIRAANDNYAGGQAYSGFQPFADYDYTFRTYYCHEIDCYQEVGAWAFPNSFITSKDQSKIMATDITVPIDVDFELDYIEVYLWVLPGANIQNADIVFYEDDSGAPGVVINTLNDVIPSSQSLSTNNYGYDIRVVKFDIDPQVFKGQLGNIKTYWVSFDVEASVGSANIGATHAEQLGYASYISPDNGVTWNENEGWDISYRFEGTCEPIVSFPCENAEIEVNQISGNDCMGIAAYGVAQSFIAEAYENAGAAIKFFAPSQGYDVTLSIWDNLPNAGGNKLVSKTTQTVGENWVEVYWDQVLPVTPGEVYYLRVEGPSWMPCVAGVQTDMYEGGHVYSGENFDPHPDWDYVFKIYSCDGGGPVGNCHEEILNDHTYESGVKTSSNSPYLVANDITVLAAEDFSLTGITANIIADKAIFNVDVFYYEDNSGLPGAEIGSQMSAPIVHQTIVGERSGFDVIDVTLSVDPFMFEGQYADPTSYWIALDITSLGHSPDVYWTITTAVSEGNETAQREGNGAWFYPLENADGIYNWEGNCTDIPEPVDPVGVKDHEINGFSFYPNPSNDIINLTSDESIESIEIYNVLGQRVIHRHINAINSSINVSELSPGTYLMKVTANGVTGTYKVMKI